MRFQGHQCEADYFVDAAFHLTVVSSHRFLVGQRPRESCTLAIVFVATRKLPDTTWDRGWSALVLARAKKPSPSSKALCDSALTIESDFSKEPERELEGASPD